MISRDETQGTLKTAIEAAKAGNQEEAYRLLRRLVAADPENAVAWLWLAAVSPQPEETWGALDRVQHLDPDHPRLAAARRWAGARATGAGRRPQTEALPRFAPGSAADGVQTVPPSREDWQEGSKTAVPSPETVAPAASTPMRWPRRYLVGLAGVGTVLVAVVLALVFWGWVSTAQAEPPAPATPDNSQRALALQPELNAALTGSRWQDAIAILQVMRALDPENPALRRELAAAFYQLAVDRRDQGDLAGALAALDESLTLAPDDPAVQQERRLAGAYEEGIEYHQAGNWQATIEALTPVRNETPAYLDLVELLYSAYYNLGMSQQAAGDLPGAQASYQAAVELMPDEPLARQKADEVTWLLRPPTPTPVPTPTPLPTPIPTPTPTPVPNSQRIVVDISEQRMYVYEGDSLIWKWVVSTGEPGRDTAVGQFAIQSKIDVAYASTWNLDMPYWLGIYWSGPMENGIHALPIQRATGYKLWDGYLGQRVSYGCVILSDENARTLFNWVKMGTPVVIQL